MKLNYNNIQQAVGPQTLYKIAITSVDHQEFRTIN